MPVLGLGLRDLLDILIVGSAIWAGLVWLPRTRARLAVPALLVIGGVYLISGRLELQLTSRLLQGFFAFFVLVLVVVFQEDLRRLFEQISALGLRQRSAVPRPPMADLIARVAARLAETRTGALVVFPGREPLDRHLEGGIELGGRLSEPLLLSLFDGSSPGHDGAVVVSGDRVERFAVHLPLSSDRRQLGQGGTRHAAALGLAERTDALCLVVSEERGTLSVASAGTLRRVRDAAELADALGALRVRMRSADSPRSWWQQLRQRWREGVVGLASAALLWALLVPGEGVVEVQRIAPVVVENLPAGFALEAVEPEEVTVSVRGRRRDLVLAERDALRVRIDALLAQLGRRTFEIGPQRVDHPPELEVVDVEPRRIRLRIVPSEPEP